MSLGKLVLNLTRLLSPSPKIGGLEITDSAIRFSELKKDGDLNVSLRLPPDIWESGKIKEGKMADFGAALKNLHSQLSADNKKIINAILTLPDSSVYIQSFSVSRVAEDNLMEAADLNLRMLSPIPVESSYYGWQRIAGNEASGDTIELLGAFAPISNVDGILLALHEAGFGVAAVEFAALSLVRQLNTLKLVDKALPHLIIHVTTSGFDFIVVKNGNLYFDYFYPWNLIQADYRNIPLDKLKEVVRSEMSKVFNFYVSHWGGQIKNLLVITPTLGEEFRGMASEKFPDSKTEILSPESVTVVGGAAIRGRIPRGEDFDISLTSESAAKIFEQEQDLHFIAIWRNIISTVAGFMLLVFSITDIYLSRSVDSITRQGESSVTGQIEEAELLRLESKAKDFNKLVELVGVTKISSREISPFLIQLNNLAGASISFDKIYLQSLDKPAAISGSALSQDAIFKFEERLKSQTQLADVNLPFSSIVTKPNGQFSFDGTFRIQGLDFKIEVPEAELRLEKEKKKDKEALSKELVNVTDAVKAIKPVAKGPIITFGRLDFTSVSDPATLEVSALDEEVANFFKNKLEQSPNFHDVEIISGFKKLDNGMVRFSIRFWVSL